MNLQQLYYFREIACCKQYTKAAENLHVSQSRLSHAMTELEEELGVQLFQRETRGVSLTWIGTNYLTFVEQALTSLEQGNNMIQEFVDPEIGRISIAYLASLENVIPKMMAKFYTETGRLRTRFNLDQFTAPVIEQRIAEGKLDYGISTRPRIPGLEYHPIGEQETVIIVPKSHRLADCESVHLAELADEHLIVYNEKCTIRSYIAQVFQTLGLKPKVLVEVGYDNIIFGLVAAGYGYALVPKMFALRNYDVAVLKIADEIPTRMLHLIWSKNHLSTAAFQCFREFIIENQVNLNEFQV